MIVLLWAALSMAVKDCLGVLLVIAEARGRAVLAGALDAGSDLATILVTVFGAGEVIVHGWDVRSVEILLTLMVTSFFGTMGWTRVGRRMKADTGLNSTGGTV